MAVTIVCRLPGGSDGKESACSAGDLGSIPGSGRYPGKGNGYPLENSRLENSMDWQATAHGVAKSPTQSLQHIFTYLKWKWVTLSSHSSLLIQVFQEHWEIGWVDFILLQKRLNTFLNKTQSLRSWLHLNSRSRCLLETTHQISLPCHCLPHLL